MRYLRYIFLISAITLSLSASAQRFGGQLMDRDGMMSSDVYNMSQANFGFGTARSMAMAGAFTSLGADMSAMGINPAGLGMYRSNEISITSMIGMQKADNTAASSTSGFQNWGENSSTRFAPSNLGIVFNAYEGGKTDMISLNFGIGHNRIADLNYNYGYSSVSAPSTRPLRSIVDAFSLQLGSGGVFPDKNGNLNYDFGDAYYWGGILAYNGWLLDAEGEPNNMYWTDANTIGTNASIGHTMAEQSRGSIGEIEIAFGANLLNKLYLGATLGVQTVSWKRKFSYSEDYIYNGQTPISGFDDSGSPIPVADPAEWMDYDQWVDISGSGINLKLGLIYRPIQSLRFGVAFHTPTYYSLEREYQAFMGTNFSLPYNRNEGDITPVLADTGENFWGVTSPARLMLGASWTIAKMAIISVDYERTWYNSMRVKSTPKGFDIRPADYRAQFKEDYQGGNTIRAGVEVKPLPFIALRAGYGFANSMLRHDKDEYTNRPQSYQTECLSAGIGISFGRTTVDLAYQHINNKQTSYQLFWATDAAGEINTASPTYTTNLLRNYAVLTINYRF